MRRREAAAADFYGHIEPVEERTQFLFPERCCRNLRTLHLPELRVEAQFTALRYSTLDGTVGSDHKEQGGMIRRHIIWPDRKADHRHLRAVVDRANVA
jgi:hypothetical protein